MSEAGEGFPPPAKPPGNPVARSDVKGRAIGLTPPQTRDVIAAVSNKDTLTLTQGQMRSLLAQYPRGTPLTKILADIASGKTIIPPSEILPSDKKA